MRIPKKIWWWWSGDVPPLVERCILQWRKLNPDYQIVKLNEQNLSQYTNQIIVNKINYFKVVQQKADLVRLAVLCIHGGIWMDASIILRKSLDWFIDHGENYDFVGYYTKYNTLSNYDQTSPVIENWMFACTAGCPFVRDWFNEFLSVTNYPTILDYVKETLKLGVSAQGLSGSLEYHTAYLSCQKVLQLPKEKYKIYLIKSDDTAFNLQVKYKWSTLFFSLALASGKEKQQPVTKLIKQDRETLNKFNNFDFLFE